MTQSNHNPMGNQGSSTGKSAKKPFNAKEFSEKVSKVFQLIQDIIGIVIHFLISIFMVFWNTLIGLLLGVSQIVSRVAESLSSELMAAMWVGLAMLVCVVTLFGWWYMGGKAAVYCNDVLNMGLNPLITCWVSLIVGFFLNAQQVQTKIWTMSKNTAAIWNKSTGGKVDLETASTDYGKFITAKARKDTFMGQCLEAAIQAGYAVVLGTNVFFGIGWILANLVLPEWTISKAAVELNAIKMRMYG